MSHRIVAKLCVRRRLSLPFLRNLFRRDWNENNRIVSSGRTAYFLSPFAITNTLRTISPAASAGLFLQPSQDAPSGWLALSAFFGLPLALWAYKCLMLIIFQRKVIYMGYVPPGSRTELLADVYPKYTPNGIHIEELSISSSRPNTTCMSTILLRSDLSAPPRHVVVYLQGNAGNPLHRIPMFATLLNAVPSLAIIAPAPRSYWTSTAARPTQEGLIADYAAAVAFAASCFPTSYLTLYGHSLGASAALCLLVAREHVGSCAPSVADANEAAIDTQVGSCRIQGLVLENAFTSVSDMLRELYPQRWLPYRYLGPFVRDRWDARAAAHGMRSRALAHRAMVLVSARDEVIPPTMGKEIFDALKAPIGKDGEMGRLVVLERALHEDAWRYRDWSQAMKQYFCDLERKF